MGSDDTVVQVSSTHDSDRGVMHFPGTDITVNSPGGLNRDDARRLISLIRTIPDFPEKGIHFRDMLPVLADARAFSIMLDALAKSLPVPTESFDVIAGLEARGFLIGAPLAAVLKKGFVAVRKAGKLPPKTFEQGYALEYGHAEIEMEQRALQERGRVLIVDDLIATGGTAHAAEQLIHQAGGSVIGCSFVMELIGLNGRGDLGDHPISSLLTMPA